MKKLLIVLLTLMIQLSGFTEPNYKKIKVSNNIELIKISDNAYIHTSYAELPEFGRFPSNGLIFVNKGKAFLFDTPVTDSLTKDLTSWISDSLKLKIVGFVPNHWHSDCMGGLGYLQSLGIESYANQMTIDIAKMKGLPVPQHGFKDSLTLSLGNKMIKCYYFGAGHSLDNIVVWIPSEKILFAGCMAKELNAKGLGNVVDGDIKEWPKTIDKVLHRFKEAKIVIPGHGQFGGLELIKHTRDLFTK